MNKEKRNIDLEKITKENPFVIPDGYFEKLPGFINEAKNKPHTGSLRDTPVLIRNFRPLYYAAAVVVVLLATTMFLVDFRSPDGDTELVELSWEEVSNDIYYVYAELDMYNIIESLVSNDNNDVSETIDNLYLIDDIRNNELDSSISTEEILDYLSEEAYYSDDIYNM